MSRSAGSGGSELRQVCKMTGGSVKEGGGLDQVVRKKQQLARKNRSLARPPNQAQMVHKFSDAIPRRTH